MLVWECNTVYIFVKVEKEEGRVSCFLRGAQRAFPFVPAYRYHIITPLPTAGIVACLLHLSVEEKESSPRKSTSTDPLLLNKQRNRSPYSIDLQEPCPLHEKTGRRRRRERLAPPHFTSQAIRTLLWLEVPTSVQMQLLA